MTSRKVSEAFRLKDKRSNPSDLRPHLDDSITNAVGARAGQFERYILFIALNRERITN